uniref:DUF7595 domain-containing protein n=1 Tax=Aegilops tauschii TaxID=37682 RepID=N1R0U7_AEGTA
MSTERRVRRCSSTESATTPATGALPIDLLLEIVARSDLTTVVRCTAASRIDRRAILDPAFVRRLALRNTVTGRIAHLPPTSVRDDYHAFLSSGDGNAGSSYELLVADNYMKFQIFSSKNFFDGQWGAVREAPLPEQRPPRLRASSRPAVVIGRTVYWLCPANFWEREGSHGIVACALDVDAAEETAIQLPPGCLFRMMLPKKDKHLLLASVRGLLSLLVVETYGLSMWTLTPASSPEHPPTWSRQLLVGRADLQKPVGLVSSPLPFALDGFGERSGAVICGWTEASSSGST